MQKLTKQTIRIYWQHSRRYQWYIFGIAFGVLVVLITDVAQPYLHRALINRVTEGDPTDFAPLLEIMWWIFAVLILYNSAWRFVVYLANKLQGKTKRNLYRTGYNYVMNHSTAFFSNNFVGSLVAKMSRYDRAYETIADELIFGMGRTAVMIVFILAALAFQIPIAAAILAIWVVVFLVISIVLNQRRYKYDLSAAQQDTIVTAHVADTMTNSGTIKLFAAESVEKSTFADLTQEQYLRRRKSWDFSNYIDMFQGAMMAILELVMLYVALRLWQAGRITVGDFVLLQSFITTIWRHLWDMGRNLRRLFQSVADANEMTAILMTAHGVQDKPNSKAIDITRGKVEFKNLSFQYKGNESIFENFNLTITAGERVALVGPSGGGKSTIVKLLFRFYDLNSGTIEIDEQDISKATQQSLREQISLVPQDPILFHRSILENIRYAKPDATEEEIYAAAKAAHCHEFIDRLPKKYETFVGERGVKLSGGERQRVAIARAILKNAPILVLDEATSSLDSESENLIQDALKTLMSGKTTIVIAHRLSTIMATDRIVVIEGGKITEQGKHEELLKAQEGKYQKLWHIQSGSYAN